MTPTPRPRWSEVVRSIQSVPPFVAGRRSLEQVATPAEAAAAMLRAAWERDDLAGRSVVDLGAGTGRLAIGAALLGAGPVVAVEVDPAAAELGRAASDRAGVEVRWEVREVFGWRTAVDTVLMNPPFGAQRRGADRPFWESAFAVARRAVYAFGLAASRSFIAGRAVARGAHVETTQPVPWELPRVFPHHRRDRVPLAVDLWVIRRKGSP
jgi:putative methylase